MNKEELINDINKIMKEIIDMLDETELVEFKKELEKACICLKYANELNVKLNGE